jgi:hypothetical protein
MRQSRLIRALGIVAAIVLGSVLTLTGTALASSGRHHHRHASHAARHRRSNRGPRGPRGYRGYTGERGPQGPAGPQGPQGPAGPGSGSVLARIRLLGGPFTTAMLPAKNLAPVPLTTDTWIQSATGFDRVYVQLQITDPSVCSNGKGGEGKLEGSVLVDGNVVSTFTNNLVGAGAGNESQELSFSLFDPGVVTPHTFSVQAGDTCAGGPNEHFTLKTVEADVVETT